MPRHSPREAKTKTPSRWTTWKGCHQTRGTGTSGIDKGRGQHDYDEMTAQRRRRGERGAWGHRRDETAPVQGRRCVWETEAFGPPEGVDGTHTANEGTAGEMPRAPLPYTVESSRVRWGGHGTTCGAPWRFCCLASLPSPSRPHPRHLSQALVVPPPLHLHLLLLLLGPPANTVGRQTKRSAPTPAPAPPFPLLDGYHKTPTSEHGRASSWASRRTKRR